MTFHEFMVYVDWVQLFGAVCGAVGAFLAASQRSVVRQRAFQWFAASNGFLLVWSFDHQAWWLLSLQCFFVFTSARGIWANRSKS